MRLNIDWQLDSGETGRERVEIEFLGEPQLADNWFDAEGHYEGFRRRIQLDFDDKLDGTSPGTTPDQTSTDGTVNDLEPIPKGG